MLLDPSGSPQWSFWSHIRNRLTDHTSAYLPRPVYYWKPKLIRDRKKYRKMKHTFEEKMRESTSLFKEEQRATDIARRLQENNE